MRAETSLVIRVTRQDSPTPPDVPGMVIAFSTEPGSRAKDKHDSIKGSGPYAGILAEEMLKPGLSIRDVFDNVGQRVVKLIVDQKPWTSTSHGMSKGLYLNGRLTREEQDRLERDAARLARESIRATES